MCHLRKTNPSSNGLPAADGELLAHQDVPGLSSPGRLLVRSLSVAVALLDDLGSRGQAAARPLTFNDRRASSQRTPALQASTRPPKQVAVFKCRAGSCELPARCICSIFKFAGS